MIMAWMGQLKRDEEKNKHKERMFIPLKGTTKRNSLTFEALPEHS